MMILARISTAIREQNWFAVVLEFVIVIAGVVIGFQVTAWNEARAERSQETDLLLRLHNDVIVLQAGRSEVFDNHWMPINLALSSARPIAFGLTDRSTLTEEECEALAMHAFIIPPPVALPTLEELLAAGRIEVISDPDIRSAAGYYDQRRAFRASVDERALAVIRPLSHAHPDLIRSRLVPEPLQSTSPEDGFDRTFECDPQTMPQHEGFLAMLTTNVVAFRDIVTSRRVLDGDLEVLHAALDRRLGISHEDNEAAP